MPTLLGRADWSAGASQRLLGLQRQLATLQIETLLQQGRPRDAAQHAHTAAQALKGGTPQARALAAARLHLAAGDPSSALPPLDGLINEAPDDPEPYLLRARVHEAMKNTEAAKRDLLTMRALLPSDDVAGQLAAVRVIGADRGTARAWIAELLARHPQDDAVLLEAASQARRDGHYEQALQHLRRVTAAPVAGATLIAPNEVPLLIPRDPIVVATAAPRVDSPSRTRALASAREQIDAIESRRQPRVEAAWTSFSRRSSPGISTLHGSELPMLAVWAPGYDGHRFVQVDAVQLDADPLPAGFADAALFGKVRALAAGQDLAAPVAQRQRGLSAGVGWRGEDRRWDIGFVGAGLKVPNLVGGWRESGSWRHSDWSAEFSRRPLTGSLLSYAGAADPITGEVWGGIVNTSLAVRAARDLTPVLSASSSLRAGVLSGRNVRRNPMLQWRTAVERQWLLTPDLSVSVGLALSLWHYRHNEGFYTFGLGGYYSPQRYVGLALPVQAQGRWGRWSFDVRASVSQSVTWEQDVPYHPTNAPLQAAAGNAVHRGGRGGGFGYSLRGAVEYHLTPHLSLGTSLDLDRSDDYAPTRGMFYLRYLFPALTGAVPVPPRPVLPYSQY